MNNLQLFDKTTRKITETTEISALEKRRNAWQTSYRTLLITYFNKFFLHVLPVLKVECSKKTKFYFLKVFIKLFPLSVVVPTTSGGCSNSGARGKDFQKLMFSRKEKGL